MDEIFTDPEFAQFYDLDNEWRDEVAFCCKLTQEAETVLDLGCGTGFLTTKLPSHCRLTGVDPAHAMLEGARRQAGSDRVTWIEADARNLRLGSKFDLILMTGHAFQCFLTDEDQLLVCRTIAAHLNTKGHFIFDSRNPGKEGWRGWTPELSRRLFVHPDIGPVEAWNDVNYDAAGNIATYETIYRNAQKTWRATSRIRFSRRDGIEARLYQAGLHSMRWMGSWSGEEFHEDAVEMIPLGRLA
jgi:SAM-dependent methyltransferase